MREKTKSIRYGEYVGSTTVSYRKLSYNELTPKPRYDAEGNEIPYEAAMLRPKAMDVFQILRPYVSVRFKDQFRSVAPLAAYLFLFQYLVIHHDVEDPWIIIGGFLSVVAGLMMFMEGIRTALMPFGETIGDSLPAKLPLWGLLLTAFILGFSVTFAEPAVGALKIAGSFVKGENAPYLYMLLNSWQGVMLGCIGAGVGGAAALGSLRFVTGWSLKPLIILSVLPALALSAYIAFDSRFGGILGFAWDCGAITTGPVTVPIVLALGIGIASSAGRGDAPLAGFGIVTLASLYPVIGVMLLAVYVAGETTLPEVMAFMKQNAAQAAAAEQTWLTAPPFADIITGLQAVLPLVALLLFILIVILREKIRKPDVMIYGVAIATFGMALFNIGLSFGLSKLGAQTGGLAPAAFVQVPAAPGSPIFSYFVGAAVAVLFTGFLGFGATYAEPALSAMGETVQNLTNGVYTKRFLIFIVSLGGGIGTALGLVKIIAGIPLIYIILPGYALALLLTALSSEEFVNVAWDSAAVTTGPVTVPLMLAIGLGFGSATHAADGFGILTIASLSPIIFVLATGIWIQWKIKRSHAA